MKKNYGLKIGEDVIYFTTIEFDDVTALPLNESESNRLNILLNVDTIINITDLDTVPTVNSTWDGISFSDSNQELLYQPLSDLGPRIVKRHIDYDRFAFIGNNILLSSFYYGKNSPTHEAIVAALSSDPQVIEME